VSGTSSPKFLVYEDYEGRLVKRRLSDKIEPADYLDLSDPASVERLGIAMEQACDALAVNSLCPADAAVLLARLREPLP
jgi:hypothetical protein